MRMSALATGLSRHGPRTSLAILCCAVCALAADAPNPETLPSPPVKDWTGIPALPVREVRDLRIVVRAPNAEPRTLRLIGVEVPAANVVAANAFLDGLLRGESVYLERDPNWPADLVGANPRSRDPAHDAEYVYLYRAPDGLFLNLELIRQGYAPLTADQPFEHEALFRAYESHARRCHKGLWAVGESPPTATRPAAASAPAKPRDPTAAGTTTVYVTEHGKKYHRKDCAFAKQGATAITLQEAKAKGCTPCSRCKPPG
jgi:endonuclease YncB( thermonuclease family)